MKVLKKLLQMWKMQWQTSIWVEEDTAGKKVKWICHIIKLDML